jgi:hypothetical protein
MILTLQNLQKLASNLFVEIKRTTLPRCTDHSAQPSIRRPHCILYRLQGFIDLYVKTNKKWLILKMRKIFRD